MPALSRNVLPRMRDRRRRQARLPALPAPHDASARTEAVTGATVPASNGGLCGARLFDGSLFSLLQWRANISEQHLILGGSTEPQLPGQTHE